MSQLKRCTLWASVRAALRGSIEMKAVAAVACGAALLAVLAGIFLANPAEQQLVVPDADPSMAEDDPKAQEPEPILLYVDVGGAVRAPGVYQLPEGSRVQDALEAAGGLMDDAVLSSLNRASLVVDGQKVYVPRADDMQVASQPSEAGGGPSPSSSAALISINSATMTDLDALPGVGPATAQAIVDHRDENGPFSKLEDLMLVEGIGEKKFAKLKDQVCL